MALPGKRRQPLSGARCPVPAAIGAWAVVLCAPSPAVASQPGGRDQSCRDVPTRLSLRQSTEELSAPVDRRVKRCNCQIVKKEEFVPH